MYDIITLHISLLSCTRCKLIHSTVLHNKGQSIKGLYLKALYLKHKGKNQSAYECSALSALSKSGFSDVYRGI